MTRGLLCAESSLAADLLRVVLLAVGVVASFASDTDWLVAFAVSESTVVLLSVATAKLTGGLIDEALTDVSAVVPGLVLGGLTGTSTRAAEPGSVLDGWD